MSTLSSHLRHVRSLSDRVLVLSAKDLYKIAVSTGGDTEVCVVAYNIVSGYGPPYGIVDLKCGQALAVFAHEIRRRKL